MHIIKINNDSCDDGLYYYKDPECTILHREDGPAIEYADGTKEWYLNGKRHREDGPAVEYVGGHQEWWINGSLHRQDGPSVETDGTKRWYLNGKLHREDGPAVECANGHKEWYLNGRLHREDGPAVELANGDKEWYINDKLHREDGPAIEYSDGGKLWYLNGTHHREDGPAIEYSNGYKEWHINGKLHREDGPAIEDADGNKEYWINGNKIRCIRFNNFLNTIKNSFLKIFNYKNQINHKKKMKDMKYLLRMWKRTLAKIILPRLKRFKEYSSASSSNLASKQEWNSILDKMIFSFELIASEKYWTISKEEYEKCQEGLKLFAEYYQN